MISQILKSKSTNIMILKNIDNWCFWTTDGFN